MGTTSKPLHIQISKDLYDANMEQWTEMSSQGHVIEVLGGTAPDIYLAPYAMRMTGNMLTNLPTALELAIKGARALRYSPASPEWKKGKSSAKGKSKGKRKHTTRQAETDDRGEPSPHERITHTEGSVGRDTHPETHSKGSPPDCILSEERIV